MKRSLVAAAAVTLLLAGCATGETGHLDPEISPDLAGPRSQPVPVTSGDGGQGNADEAAEEEGVREDEGEGLGAGQPEDGEGDGAGGEGTEGEGAEGSTDAAPATGAPANDVEAALEQSSSSQSWFADVTGVDVADDSVLVSTQLTETGADASAVCEAVLAAAQSAGIASPSIEVRTSDGEVLAQRDPAAGDEGCSS